MAKLMTVLVVLLLIGVSCRADSLNATDIVDWKLTVTDPTSSVSSFTILGPLSGNNSQLGLKGVDLTSTATELLFNFNGTDSGYFIVQSPTLFNGFNFWCLQILPGQCSNQDFSGEALATNGPTFGTPLSGNLVVASGGHANGSDIIYDVNESFTIGSTTFTATGTVETDGRITATPEPPTLSLLGLALCALSFSKLRTSRNLYGRQN
jgi:hypothetical protein